MDELQQGIITLVKSAVTGEKLPLSETFSLTEAYPVMKKHSVLTLGCDGAIRCGISFADPTLKKMLGIYTQHMLKSERQMAAVKRLLSAFEEQGIDYLPMKGCIMKTLYPKQELRSMGDADILIRMEQYEEIEKILAAQEYVFENEYNHTINLRGKDLYLELHKRVVPTTEQDLYRYFGDGWDHGHCVEGRRYAMSPEDTYIYLFCHFVKHYRHGGIGCRHMTDLWVYRRAYPGMDEEYLEKEFSKLNLLEFYRNVRQTLEVWFENGQRNDKTEWITNVVFQSGNWGSWEASVIANSAKLRAEQGGASNVRTQTLLETIFPRASGLAYKFPFLEKYPFLLPIAWVLRWVEVLRFRRGNIPRRFAGTQLVTDEKVSDYESALRYVGLGYNTTED